MKTITYQDWPWSTWTTIVDHLRCHGWTVLFGSEETAAAVKKRQKRAEVLYAELLLCIRARACGWQLLTMFPGEARLKAARKRSIMDARKLELSKWAPVLSATVRAMARQVVEGIVDTEKAILALESPMRIIAKVEHGKIVATCPA